MTLLRLTLLPGALLVLLLAALCISKLNRAYQRITGGSQQFESALGAIEYSSGGTGPPVLVIHGSGGGYDQGELLAATVLGDDFHWISPSRFGYLRSSLPPGASFDTQAEAYALLLDHLGIDQVAVVALSHGGPSALLFAARYPARVSALALISCGVAASTEPGQRDADRLGAALTRLYQHDILYWGLSTLLRKQLLKLLGADASLLAGMSPSQRDLANRVVDYMNPVAPRAAGVRFDNSAALPDARIAAIEAPTLIFHASNDTLQRFHNAEFAVAAIPHATLKRYDHGGHLLLVVEQDDIRTQVQQFVSRHAQEGVTRRGASE